MKVLLINESDNDFKDKYNGKEIIIPSGKAAKVEEHIAHHFIGDPKLLKSEDANEAAAEQKRINFRYGAFKPEERIIKVPKLRIEVMPEEEAIEVVEVKKKTVPEKNEEEFKGLKERVKK